MYVFCYVAGLLCDCILREDSGSNPVCDPLYGVLSDDYGLVLEEKHHGHRCIKDDIELMTITRFI